MTAELPPYKPGDFARAYPPHYARIDLLDAGVGECCEACLHHRGPEEDCGRRALTAEDDGAYVWVRCACFSRES